MANITHRYNEKTKTYDIDNFDIVRAEYLNWITNNFHTDAIIVDEETYKNVYKERTTLRKEIDTLKKDKKTIDSIILGTFDSHAKEIVDLLTDVDDRLTELLDNFKPKEPVYEVKFKTKDIDKYNKIMAFIATLEGEEK